MRRICKWSILILALAPFLAFGQENASEPFEGAGAEQQSEVFVIVEEMPHFPGGEDSLFAYLADRINYPDAAVDARIQGVVYIQFIVETDGNVSGPKVLRGIGGGCDEEALRVIADMPRWYPGKQRGETVRVQYNLPIRFAMAPSMSDPSTD